MTKQEVNIIDQLLSGDDFVTYDEIVCGIIAPSNDEQLYEKTKAKLRKFKERHLADVLEYQNDSTAFGGMRFKKGFKNYLRYQEEEKNLKKKKGDAKSVYATRGLEALLNEPPEFNCFIELECCSTLFNLKFVKKMANAILFKQVKEVTYKTNNGEIKNVTFHPQYLKEYNNRWAVYGKCDEELECNYPTCIRIDSIFKIVDKEGKYLPAAPQFYQNYFKDIIGFTRSRGGKVQSIYIRTNSSYIHNLIKTKPFHPNQDEVEEFSEEKGYGKFKLEVIPNTELRTKLLAYGVGITLEGNGWFQKEFKEEVRKMAELYMPGSV